MSDITERERIEQLEARDPSVATCNVCGAEFMTQEALDEHVIEIHGDAVAERSGGSA